MSGAEGIRAAALGLRHFLAARRADAPVTVTEIEHFAAGLEAAAELLRPAGPAPAHTPMPAPAPATAPLPHALVKAAVATARKPRGQQTPEEKRDAHRLRSLAYRARMKAERDLHYRVSGSAEPPQTETLPAPPAANTNPAPPPEAAPAPVATTPPATAMAAALAAANVARAKLGLPPVAAR